MRMGVLYIKKLKNRHIDNPIYSSDLVQYRFLEEHDLATSYTINYLFENVKK